MLIDYIIAGVLLFWGIWSFVVGNRLIGYLDLVFLGLAIGIILFKSFRKKRKEKQSYLK